MRGALARIVAAAIVVASLDSWSPAAFGQAVPRPRPPVAEVAPAKIDHGTVYLFRGLMNVFSLGMNTLAKQLNARGVATTVTNHSHGSRLANQLAKRYRTDKSVLPIIIIGHSLGANRALEVSAQLGESGIPVRLVVLFDATVSIPVPLNVREVLNLHKPSRFGVAVKGAPGYTGTIDNQDVSAIPGVGHISIDKAEELHAVVVAKVLSVLAEPQSRR